MPSGSGQPKEKVLPMSHVLPDLLRPGLRLVVCGTAAGAVSAAKGAYYAGFVRLCVPEGRSVRSGLPG